MYGNREEKIHLRNARLDRYEANQRVKNEATQRDSGSWFRKYQTGADELEQDDQFSKTRQSGKMLDEFISQSATQEDDDDIYRQY